MLDKQFTDTSTATRAEHISRIYNDLNSVPALKQRFGRGAMSLIQAETSRTLGVLESVTDRLPYDATLLPYKDIWSAKNINNFTEIIPMPGIDEAAFLSGLPNFRIPSRTFSERMQYAVNSQLNPKDIKFLDDNFNPARFVNNFNLNTEVETTDGPFGRLLINRLNLWMGKYYPEFPDTALNRLQTEPIKEILTSISPVLRFNVLILENPDLIIGKGSPIDLQRKRLISDLVGLANDGLIGASRLMLRNG